MERRRIGKRIENKERIGREDMERNRNPKGKLKAESGFPCKRNVSVSSTYDDSSINIKIPGVIIFM